MTTIVLADDHPVVRNGLRAILEAEQSMEVLGEAADGLEALDMVQRLKPDVLILDVMMPGLGGLEVARRVSQVAPSTRVVVLSMHPNEAYVLEALRNGAAAYVLKSTSMSSLVEAVREVLAGHRYLSPPLTERAIQVYVSRTARANEGVDRYDLLTNREREVLPLAAQGYSYSEIGDRLSISPRTAETHRTNLMRKLSLKSQTDLLRFALERGLIAGD